MALLVKSCFDTASKFQGKGVTTKIGKKKHQVYFKVYCDDTSVVQAIDLACKSSNIVMLEYQGNPSELEGIDTKGVYIAVVHDFGMDISLKDIEMVKSEIPDGVTFIVKLPNEFNDMQFIMEVNSIYKDIRFCGGTMFCLEGCKLGCCGKDILDKKGIKYPEDVYLFEGCCCGLETLSEEDVELEEGKVQSEKSGRKSGGTKKKVMFADLLYANGTVGF